MWLHEVDSVVTLIHNQMLFALALADTVKARVESRTIDCYCRPFYSYVTLHSVFSLLTFCR